MEIFKIGELINYCLTRKSSYTIKDAIDSVLTDNLENNFRIILGLMEEIEIQYPQLKGILDLHKKEVPKFTEAKFPIDIPKVEYIYSYILHLGEKIFRKDVYNSEAANNNFSPHETFDSKMSDEELFEIAKKLMANKVIKKISQENFTYAFRRKPIKEMKVQIQWLNAYNKHQNDNIGISMLIYKLCPIEVSKDFKCVSSKVNKIFKNKAPWDDTMRSIENSLRGILNGDNPKTKGNKALQALLET